MNKIITTALLLSAGTVLSNAAIVVGETVTATPSASESATTANVTKKGFTLDFGNSATFSSDELSGATLALTSVSIKTTATNFGDAKLGVYKIADSSDKFNSWSDSAGANAIKSFESFVGLSSSTGTHSGGAATFTFDDLSLDFGAWYAFIFIRSDNTTDLNPADLTGTSLAAIAMDNDVSYNKQFTAYNSSEDNGLAFGNMLNAGSSNLWNSKQTADATYSFKVLSVPEPSAFGLLAGLGALALVASRRRRSRK